MEDEHTMNASMIQRIIHIRRSIQFIEEYMQKVTIRKENLDHVETFGDMQRAVNKINDGIAVLLKAITNLVGG